MSDISFDDQPYLIIPKGSQSFLEKFGGVFEDSPHFATQAFEEIQEKSTNGVCLTKDFHDAMVDVVKDADSDQQLELIKAHPELGAKLDPEEIGEDSVSEQKGVGLHEAPEEIKNSLRSLNGQYMDCLLYTSPSPRDQRGSRMPSSA